MEKAKKKRWNTENVIHAVGWITEIESRPCCQPFFKSHKQLDNPKDLHCKWWIERKRKMLLSLQIFEAFIAWRTHYFALMPNHKKRRVCHVNTRKRQNKIPAKWKGSFVGEGNIGSPQCCERILCLLPLLPFFYDMLKFSVPCLMRPCSVSIARGPPDRHATVLSRSTRQGLSDGFMWMSIWIRCRKHKIQENKLPMR